MHDGFGSFMAVIITFGLIIMGYRMLKHKPPFDK